MLINEHAYSILKTELKLATVSTTHYSSGKIFHIIRSVLDLREFGISLLANSTVPFLQFLNFFKVRLV